MLSSKIVSSGVFLKTTETIRLLLSLVNCSLFLEDNRYNRNNKKNGRNCGMSRGDIQQRQQDYCSHSSTAPCFWKTTETTKRTEATGRCHEVTYNRDNKITVVERLSNENNNEAHLTLCQFRRICKVDYIGWKKCAGRWKILTTGNVGINISKHRFYASEVPFTLPREARLTILAANIVNLGGQNSLSHKPKKSMLKRKKHCFGR